MESRNLRVGNKVDLYGKTATVEGIDFVHHYTQPYHHFDKFKPIKVTEEWLDGFGITIDKWFQNNSFKITKDEDYGWEMHVINANRDKHISFAYFKYVHQLQNLYSAITEEELELNKYI